MGDKDVWVESGIFIRVQVEGRWQSVDIADPKVPVEEVARWLCDHTEKDLNFMPRLIFTLLGRREEFDKVFKEVKRATDSFPRSGN